jgi:hypothetical protein
MVCQIDGIQISFLFFLLLVRVSLRFMKVDDDTFVVVHHLLKFLRHHNSSEYHYIGRKFFYHNQWYCEGGAGYLFSRALMQDMIPSGKYNICMIECHFPSEDTCTGCASFFIHTTFFHLI